MEGQPERDLRRELRQQERKLRREQRQAERMKALEEALTEEVDDEDEPEQKSRKHEFLEGTKLTPPAKPELTPLPAEEMPLPQESVKTEESSQGQLEFRIQRAEAVRDSEDENSAPAFPDFSRQEAPMEKEEIPAAYQDEPEEEIPETIIPEIQSEPVEETPDEEEDAYQGADWQEQLKREVRPEHNGRGADSRTAGRRIYDISEKESEIF